MFRRHSMAAGARRFVVALVVAGCIAFAGEAAAETFCGTSGAPRPVDGTSAVRLVSQSVFFNRVEGAFQPDERDGTVIEEFWRVRSSFELENVTDERVDQTVAFVDESGYGYDTCTYCECSLKPLRVAVGGERRDLEVVEQPEQRFDWVDSDDVVATVDITLAPGQSRTLVRQFVFGGPETAVYTGSESLFFHAEHGAEWKGRVEESRFVVELPTRPWRVRYSSGFEQHPKPDAEPIIELRRYVETIEEGEARTKLVVGADDWDPNVGVDFYLQHYGEFYRQCPDRHDEWRQLREEGRRDEADEILEEMAKSHSDERLRYCRNIPYARHGYDFESEELDREFYGSDDEPGMYMGHAVLGFHKNPKYTDDLLEPHEIRYAEYIKAIEAYKNEHDLETEETSRASSEETSTSSEE